MKKILLLSLLILLSILSYAQTEKGSVYQSAAAGNINSINSTEAGGSRSIIDAGVVAILSPPVNITTGDIVTYTVRIKNFGADTIHNIPVYYQMGGGINYTNFFTGNLLPDSTVIITLLQNVITGNQSHVFTAFTDVYGDTNYFNDSCSKLINVNPLLNDVGISQIILPGAYTIGIFPQTVKIKIKNYGLQAQTSIPLTYRRGAMTPNDEIWTGLLVPGDSVIYTFANLVNVPTGSSFNICTYVHMTNDAFLHNDTICKSVSICNVSSPGSIVGANSVGTGNYSMMYRVLNSAYNAISYNWTYSGINVVINDDGNNKDTVYLNFPPAATSGVLSVRAWSGLCEGNAATLSIGVVGIENVDFNDFCLGQNIPNPTTGNTSIEYYLPSSGEIKFEIINLYGQKLNSFSQKSDAGKKSLDFSLQDLSAGIYYYTLEFKGKRLVKKMVVNK